MRGRPREAASGLPLHDHGALLGVAITPSATRRAGPRNARPATWACCSRLFGGVRNPSNGNRDIKEVLGRVDAERFGRVTCRTFRKTVATWLDDVGLSARQIADHLGHAKPSMTQDTYLGLAVASAEAAKILDRSGS